MTIIIITIIIIIYMLIMDILLASIYLNPWVFPWVVLGGFGFHEAFLKAGDAPVYVGYVSMTCYLSKRGAGKLRYSGSLICLIWFQMPMHSKNIGNFVLK